MAMRDLIKSQYPCMAATVNLWVSYSTVRRAQINNKTSKLARDKIGEKIDDYETAAYSSVTIQQCSCKLIVVETRRWQMSDR